MCLGEYQNTIPRLFVPVVLQSLQQMSLENFAFYTEATAASAKDWKT